MSKKVVALDIGGTNLRVSLVRNGRILKYIKKSTPKNKIDFLKVLHEGISEVISSDVAGIGVGSPGPLKDGIIKNPPNLPLRNFNLKKDLEKRFHKKVVVENDAHCVALAESKLGVKKKNFIVLTFGTGIGGGIIIDSKLYTGQGYAGELGHMIINDGKSFEILWQENTKYIRENFGKDILIKDLVKMKNKEADIILEKITNNLGRGIANAINIFDPEIVVLNGGLKESGKVLLDKIKNHVKRYVIIPHETTIVWSKLEHPGTLGASLLIK